MLRFIVIILFAEVIFISKINAADYYQEQLKEVLRNVNVRAKPSLEGQLLGLIPGGFVVSIDNTEDYDDWFKLSVSENFGTDAYVHKKLLSHPSMSYKLKEIRNDIHLIKNFIPRSDLDSIYPEYHSRIYDLNGNFISHFPRLEDLDFKDRVDYIATSGFEANSPHYKLSYARCGKGCYFESKYISKDPFGNNFFKVDDDLDISYNEKTMEYEAIAEDRHYTYWNYSYADSPIPIVKLRRIDGQFKVSSEMITNPPPTNKEFEILVTNQPRLYSDMNRHDANKAIGKLTGSMLNLMYSGHPKSAKEFLYAVWPNHLVINSFNFMERISYEKELIDKVKTSRYFQQWMIDDYFDQ